MGSAPADVDEDRADSAQPHGHESCNEDSPGWSGRRKTLSGRQEDGSADRDSGFVLTSGVVVGGRYRLERRIGEGGMGVVWSAQHTVTRRQVALKFLKGCRDETSRRRLVREARAAGSVSHPGIVAVHDVIESEDGEPALVMDLLDGESLRTRLSRERVLSLEETARLLLGVSGALGAAHAAGVVHRDLKPENVFALADGTTRVLDFGVAKLVPLDRETAQSAGTQSGELVGTPMFMSPEQVFGERDIDHRSDFWALGLIAYECLTGELPTASENIGQVLKTILTQRIRPLKVVAPHLPDEVCAIVDRMLSFDRNQRPWSAGEIAAVFASMSGVDVPSIAAPQARRPDDEATERPPETPMSRTVAGAPERPAIPSRRRLGIVPWLVVAGVAGSGLAVYLATRSPQPDAAPSTSTPAEPLDTRSIAVSPAISTSRERPVPSGTASEALPSSSRATPSTSGPSVSSSANPSGAEARTTRSVSPIASASAAPNVPPPSPPTSSSADLQGAVVKTHPF